MRRLLGRMALVAFGIVLGVVVLEAGLQTGAWWLHLRGQELPADWLTGGRRIVFIGDSNTYGLYLKDRRDAFPHRFEAVWNAVPDLPRIETINLGYPGTNSWRIRRELPRMLRELRPDMIVVMVGANDRWTARIPPEDAKDPWQRTVDFVKQHSRVYLLSQMIQRSLGAQRVEIVDVGAISTAKGQLGGEKATMRVGDVEFSMGWRKGVMGAYKAHLSNNLGIIADVAREFSTHLAFMTYPSEEASYRFANERIRAAAAWNDTLLVDTAPLFRQYCPREPCPEFLYGDHHPTARGHEIVADALMQRLMFTGPLARRED